MKRILKKALIAAVFLLSFSLAASAAEYESGWGKGLDGREVEARAFLKNTAQRICGPADSDYEKVRKLNEYVCQKADYDYSNNSRSISDFVYNGRAICSGYAETLAYLLDCVNVKNFTITSYVYAEDNSKTLHIWNAVYIDGKWLHVDPTWNDATRNPSNPNGNYFLVSGDEIFANREKPSLATTQDYDSFYNFIRTAEVSFKAGEAPKISKYSSQEPTQNYKAEKQDAAASGRFAKNIKAFAMQDGIVFAPPRDIAFALGGYVKESGGTVSVILGTRTLVMREDSRDAMIDGENFVFDLPPQTVDGIFMVPVRTAFERLGASVRYDETASEVTIRFDPHISGSN